MSHAETCPVCLGTGETQFKGVLKTKSCHGCAGKGWVEVGNDNIPVPYPVLVPTPAPCEPRWPYIPPRWPRVTWTYSHDRGL